jgi:DNA-binding Lrp family transcriptional regulator
MPKNSKQQINKDENKVILELLKNSNESIDKIGKKCGFSRQKVWRIIKRLEKEKTIWGYSAIVNDQKIGVKGYTALIKRTPVPADRTLVDTIISKKIEELIPNDHISIKNSFFVHGRYDWLIYFTAENIIQAKRFCDAIRTIFQGYIADINLLENLFEIRKFGKTNPNQTSLKEFL